MSYRKMFEDVDMSQLEQEVNDITSQIEQEEMALEQEDEFGDEEEGGGSVDIDIGGDEEEGDESGLSTEGDDLSLEQQELGLEDSPAPEEQIVDQEDLAGQEMALEQETDKLTELEEQEEEYVEQATEVLESIKKMTKMLASKIKKFKESKKSYMKNKKLKRTLESRINKRKKNITEGKKALKTGKRPAGKKPAGRK